jgi:hypothetical protein
LNKNKLTFWSKRFQSTQQVDRSCIADRLEPVIVRDVDMGAQVMGRKAQANDQALVAKDALFVAEDGVCELRMKGREGFGFGLAGLYYSDMDSVVGVAGP